MKRSPLRRRTPLRRTTASRYQTERKALKSRVQQLEFKMNVLQRHALCQALTAGCTFTATEAHHRKLRSQGGSNDPVNGLAVCAPCHRYIHDHPQEAYERGWMLRASDPEEPYTP